MPKQTKPSARSHGGKRAGAGRKKGALTKRTRQIAEAALDNGITPLEYMLSILRDTEADLVRRDDMAKAAAPYLHAKLSAIDHTTQGKAIPGTVIING